MTSRASRDRAYWAPAVVGLAALPLLLLAPALLGDQAFVGLHTQDLGPWRGDGAADTRPLVADQPLAVRAVTLDKTLSCWPLLDLTLTRFLRGEAPLWNPDNLCGVPLLAQATHGTLHPPNWLAAVMPMGEAFGWTAWLQSALAGIFAFLLARELGAPRVAAFLGGLTFMLSGYMSARWHWYPITGSSMYLPLALLHLTLAVRLMGGLGDIFALRQYAALTNGLVLLVFIATMVTLVRRKAPKGTP